jgi:hypothetical protein
MPVPRILLPLLFSAATSLDAAPAPFAILKLAISDMEDGAIMPPSFTFVPGQFVFVSFEVGGYQVSPERKLHLSYKVDALDPKNVPLMETIANTLETTLSDEDKNWRPKIRQQILLPPLAGSGAYKIAIHVTDDLAKATVSQEMTVQVRGHDVAPSETLIIRNFHFYRGEEDRDPLAVAAYRPGDTLFARFDIIGYKLASHNGVDVDYGLSVIAPSGKVLFTQEKAAEEKTSSFYPKPYVPGSMNLNIYKDTRPGQYTIVFTARDHVGNQTYEAKENFTVE